MYASVDGPHRVGRPAAGGPRSLLDAERPDLIGTQEGLAGQLDDVRGRPRSRYGFVGTGRDGGTDGEYTAVLYRVERLDAGAARRVLVVGHARTWSAPNTWGARCVRMVTWVRFLDRVTGRELCVVNTHFDHISEHARQRSAALIRDRVAALESGAARRADR